MGTPVMDIAPSVHITRPEELGEVIARIRKQHRLNQSELAQWVGVNRQYVSVLETGEISTQVRRLFAILDALGYEMTLAPKDPARTAE